MGELDRLIQSGQGDAPEAIPPRSSQRRNPAPPKELFAKLPPRIRSVIAACAEEYGVTVEAILGPSQSRMVVLPRRKAIHALRQMKFSMPEIGRFIHKHHTSVFHALRLPVPGGPFEPIPEPEQIMDPERTESAVWAAWVRRFPPFRIVPKFK